MKIDRINRAQPAVTDPQSIPQESLSTAIQALILQFHSSPSHPDASQSKASMAVAQQALAAAENADSHIMKLQARIAQLERETETDMLTGLLNRRGFERRVTETMAQANRYEEFGALVYIDLDRFKPINDKHGHAAGDAVLTSVSYILAANVRTTDHVARLGGDEFAVILTRATREDALKRAEALDIALNAGSLDWSGRLISIEASIGVQPFGPNDDIKSILACADRAMYRAKELRADSRVAA